MKCLVPLCALMLAAPSIALGDDAKKEETKIDGTWLATSAELAGKKLPQKDGESITLTLKKGEYELVAESPGQGHRHLQ